NALSKLAQWTRAREAYDHAIATDPKHYNAYFNRARLEFTLGRLQSAILDFDSSVTAGCPPQMVLADRASALIALGEPNQALTDLQRLSKLAPDFPNLVSLILQASMHACDWAKFQPALPIVDAIVQNNSGDIAPFVYLAATDDQARHLQAARNH